MTIIKEGRSSYGYVYVEDNGSYFMVVVGSSKYGPYSQLADALREFSRWCAG